MKDGYFLMSRPALAMVSINGYTGGAIKVIYNTFNGDVNSTKKTTYAISAGGALQNFEWTCNTFNDFETVVSYGGTGPDQNPKLGLSSSGNSFNNISLFNIENLSSNPLDYYTTISPFIKAGPVNVIYNGETPNCTVDCNIIETKYKVSPSIANVESIAFKDGLSIYPNPTTNVLNIETKVY